MPTTGVDRQGKPHSVVNLTGRRDPGLGACWQRLPAAGVGADRPGGRPQSSPAVLVLVLPAAGIGYAYRVPTRLAAELSGVWGNRSCWLAFGPLATAAACLALAR